MKSIFLKRLLSAAVSVVLLTSAATVNAAVSGTLECTISEFALEPDGKLCLTVSGEAKGSVSVFVYKSSMEPTEFSPVNMPVAFMQYDLKGSLTAFEYKIPLPEDLETGTYNIKVVAKDGSYRFVENYFYLNDAAGEQAKDAVNNAIADGPSAIVRALTENAESLMIQQEDLDTYGAFAGSLLFSRKTDDGKHVLYDTATELMGVFSEAKIIYDIENRGSDNTLEEIINENASGLGINLTADYQTNLTPSAKRELYVLLEDNDDWKIKPYADVYIEMTALASVRKAESWGALKSVVTDLYKDIINIDTTKYKSKLDDIFTKMIKYECNTFEDIKANFDKAVKAVNSDDSSSSSSSGSSRPSGGGSGMAVVGGMLSNMDGDTSDNAESNKEDTVTVRFSDLPDGHWASKEIYYLVEKNVFTGYPDGTFGGDKYITRAEFATILAKAFSLGGAAEIPFEDVGRDKWYREYVAACYSNGIINGTSETTFSPDATITREDASVMISRVLSDVVADEGGEVAFADKDEISAYALSAIKSLNNAGLINGVGDNKFAPKLYIDRQSAAKLIYGAMAFKS